MSSSGAPPKDGLARSLGWLSVALGAPQVVAPRQVVRLVGARESDRSRTVMRLVGVRELAAAAGILGRRRPAGWLWARAAGDAMDLALLLVALDDKKARPERLAGALAAVAGVAAADVAAAVRTSRSPSPGPERKPVTAAITIRQSPEAVYAFWHDFENLPRFMRHLVSVRTTGDGRSHWEATAPVGKTVAWDAEIVEDRPNELISWRSLPGADVANSGTIRFTPAPGDRGTEVRLEMEYAAPGGKIGVAALKLFGEEPEQQVRDDLRRFKQVCETGEVVRSEGSPEGRQARRSLLQRPAQPVEA